MFVQGIIDDVKCGKHGAAKGDSCWDIPLNNGKYHRGVCGTRARNAGFVGKISEKSMRSSSRPKAQVKK